MTTLKEIRKWGQFITDRFHSERVILFGSYARGNPHKDSDVDLLVVLQHEGPSAKKASEIRLSLPSKVSFDVLVRSPERLRERLRMNDSFMKEVIEKGVVLNAPGDA